MIKFKEPIEPEVGSTVWRKAAPHEPLSFLGYQDKPIDRNLGRTILVRDTVKNQKFNLYEVEITRKDPNSTITY